MPADQLYITLVQPNIVWEDKAVNLRQYETMIAGISGRKEVVVLPEMFSTGFSVASERLAEKMDGASIGWMVNMALRYRCILTGSLIIEEEGKYYNRMLWVQPDGHIGYYDKRHLFGFAKEDAYYTPGISRLITQVNGWRINLQVCYDLRFPVWARNTGEEYDVLLYVANWPEQRIIAWNTLLQARAIENQCYVAGVNRIGRDGNGNNYTGNSSVFGPAGEIICQLQDESTAYTVILEKETLQKLRAGLPFLKDADKFMLL